MTVGASLEIFCAGLRRPVALMQNARCAGSGSNHEMLILRWSWMGLREPSRTTLGRRVRLSVRRHRYALPPLQYEW
jgi:hypothetical protein